MKNIFIVNPIAGVKSRLNETIEKINQLKDKYDTETYITKEPHDATEFIKEYLKNNPDEEVRFHACGGDGTLNEVINGIIGYPKASFSSYPCGSGNDFVKCIGGAEKHLDMEALINAPIKKIDVIKADNKYGINVVDFGFDANVCKTANDMKGKSKHPYTSGIIRNLFTGMKNNIVVCADGEIINTTKKLLLCTLANGAYCGGKYKCAPRQVLDDGLLEVCIVKTMPLIKFLKLIKGYELGHHLDDPKYDGCILYKRAKEITISSSDGKEFYICVDGEVFSGLEFKVQVIEKALNLAYLGD